MSGRARAKRICQAAVGVFIDPKKAAFDLAREEVGDAFDRIFPHKADPAQVLLDKVLAHFQPPDLDSGQGEHLTATATDLLGRHGLAEHELAHIIDDDASRWAAAAREIVCHRGLTTRPPGLGESKTTWNGKPLAIIDPALEGRLRALVKDFYAQLISAAFGSGLNGSVHGYQTAILQNIDAAVHGIDRKLDGFSRPARPPSSIPTIKPPVSDFQGYEAERNALRKALTVKNATRIAIVIGIGGAGKTQLARKVAEELVGNFADSQISVDMLGSTPSPKNATMAIEEILERFGINTRAIPPAQWFDEYFRLVSGKSILIVLDDLATSAEIDSLFPPPPAALLLTSRARLPLHGVAQIELTQLAHDDAKRLLSTIHPSLNDDQQSSIASLCTALPLALRVAGLYLRVTGYDPVAYITELGQKRLERFAESVTEIASGSEREKLDPQIVLRHSYDSLAISDPETAEAFTLLGAFPVDFDLQAAMSVLCLNDRRARQRLGRLVQRGLVEYPVNNRHRLHDLLRELAQALALPDRLGAAQVRHGQYFLSATRAQFDRFFKKYDYHAMKKFMDEDNLNVIVALFNSIGVEPPLTSASDYQKLAFMAALTDHATVADSAIETALGIMNQILPHNPHLAPSKASLLTDYATLLSSQKRHDEAIAAINGAIDCYHQNPQPWLDMYRQCMARAHAIRSNCLNEAGYLLESIDASVAAIRMLRPVFLRRPDEMARWIAPMVNEYRKRCETQQQLPDSKLLGPIDEVLTRLGPDRVR